MSFTPEQAALRDRAITSTTCEHWAAQQGWPLRRSGAEFVGACPKCGGSDRFSINAAKNVWNCRQCAVGGDVIELVMHMEDLKFLDACSRITGDVAGKPMSAEEQARLAEQREADRRQQEATAADFRERARREARHIWKAATPIAGLEAGVAAYLMIRGIDGGSIDFQNPDWASEMKLPIRFQPKRAYWSDGKRLHSGPAMIAAIQLPDGRFAGVHQTYLDFAQPKGKLLIADADGKELPAKKVLGVKKGCAIRLFTPPFPDGSSPGQPRAPHRLVMGEGIETTLTAAAHAREPDTAYWAGVDLGNMAGKAARNAANSMVHDQPNMDDRECFLPPDWVTELVYLCDGDEPEKHTVEKVKRGLRRALRLREAARIDNPELQPLAIKMVPPGAAGTDLNSLAMAELDDEGGAE